MKQLLCRKLHIAGASRCVGSVLESGGLAFSAKGGRCGAVLYVSDGLCGDLKACLHRGDDTISKLAHLRVAQQRAKRVGTFCEVRVSSETRDHVMRKDVSASYDAEPCRHRGGHFERADSLA